MPTGRYNPYDPLNPTAKSRERAHADQASEGAYATGSSRVVRLVESSILFHAKPDVGNGSGTTMKGSYISHT